MKLSHKLTFALCLAMLLSPRLASVDAQQARPNQQNNGNGNQGNGNQGNGNGKHDQDEDNDVESKIDADIQGPERSVIHNAMRGLRREDRENVMLLGADGQIYANKTWLKGAASVPQRIDNNLYQDADGRQFTLPASTPKPTENTTPDGNALPQANNGAGAAAPFQTSRPNAFTGASHPTTGPYRRVYSKLPQSYNAQDHAWEPDDTKPGFSYEEGYVTLPSNRVPRGRPDLHEKPSPSPTNARGTSPTKDTAYIYMGGWSAGFTDTRGTFGQAGAGVSYLTADGGFAHDNGTNNNLNLPHPPSRDSWYMFITALPSSNVTNPTQLSGDNGALFANGIRLFPSPTTPVPMVFYISSSGGRTYLNLVTRAHAMNYADAHDLGTQTWTMTKDVTFLDGSGNPFSPWHVDGTGVVLKRMTSIGQQGTQLGTCSYIRGVQWTNCRIGYPAFFPFFSAINFPWDKDSTGGDENYPNDNPNDSRVHPLPFNVAPHDYSAETVSIILCGRRQP